MNFRLLVRVDDYFGFLDYFCLISVFEIWWNFVGGKKISFWCNMFKCVGMMKVFFFLYILGCVNNIRDFDEVV